ncbi:MAG: phage minor head protein [Chloroflexota bacterium]|nr:phage minor head protein [Chloroflexota bacterium]
MPSEIERAIARTRRQIDTLEGPVRQEMTDVYARAVRNLTTDLDLVTLQIRNAQEADVDVNPDWLRRQDRYIRLLSQAEREFARFADDGLRLIESGRVRAIRGGAAEAWEVLDAAGIETGFRANVNTRAVENALAATYDGPVKRSLDRYGADGAKTIQDALLDGIARGRGPRAIIRDIERGLLSPSNAARLESLVRTEMMRGFRAGLNEQYAQVGHLITGYRWSASKSVRTCLACLGRDGAVRKEPWDQFHVACRCVSTPVPRGSTFTPQSGAEWFAAQPESVQRRMLPSAAAFDAFKAGRVQLGDFVGTRRSRTWGTSVFQRSGRDVLARIRPQWRPTMPADEAARWAQGSSIPFTTTHVTRYRAADRITQEGFQINKQTEWGRLYGDGVYMGPDATTANFYERLYDLDGSGHTRLNMRVNTTKTMRVDVLGTETKVEELQKVIGQFPGGQRAYESKVQQITARNARIVDQVDVEEAAATPVKPKNRFAPTRSMLDAPEDAFDRPQRLQELGHVDNPNAHAINEIAEDAGYDSIWINRAVPNMREDGLGGMGPSEIIVFDPKKIVVIEEKAP